MNTFFKEGSFADRNFLYTVENTKPYDPSAEWTRWVHDTISKNIENSLNNYIVASRKNGTTTIRYVGESTGSNATHQYFSGTQIFTRNYDITAVTPAEAYEMQSPAEEEWRKVIPQQLSVGDYAALVSRLDGAIKTITGYITRADDNILSFAGENYDESIPLHLAPDAHSVYISRAEMTI